MKKCKYMIFDMDGTLLDSMPAWMQLSQRYLKKRGIVMSELASESVHRAIQTMTMAESAAYFKERFGFPESGEELVADMYCLIEKAYCEEMPLKAGVKKFVEMQYQSGVKMCVATATAAYLGQAAFERLEIADYMEFILDEAEVGMGKKTPRIYEEALIRLGGIKEETIVFEDAFYAMETAKNAGFYTVGVAEPVAAKDEARARQICDEFIESFEGV